MADLTPPSRWRLGPAFLAAGVSAFAAVAGLAAMAVAAEIWLRSTVPFIERVRHFEFVPGVGWLNRPGATLRWTNHLDFWQVQRINRHGFLDREPPTSATKPATDCRVAVIGDSFVEAWQVPIEAKMHIRLEALAAAEGLAVAASAFGRGGTGQVAQLALYDAFARHRHPELVVLVFHDNDYWDNSLHLSALMALRDPERLPEPAAVREGGALRLAAPRYPEDGAVEHRRRNAAPSTAPWIRYLALVPTERVRNRFYFGAWLGAKAKRLLRESGRPNEVAWAKVLRQRPHAAALMEAWLSSGAARPDAPFTAEEPLPAAYAAELELTAFGLGEFRARAARDGASLVVLATHHLRPGTPPFDRMRAMADELGIPVVSQHDYIVAQGGRPEDANWAHDGHWNPTGHEWAAQALWDWLRRRPAICGRTQDGVAGVG